MIKPDKPTLILNEEQCRKNIHKMAEKARKYQLNFRPHLKTAQSLAVAEWFRDEGVDKITVASLQMAEYFADGGWKDITVAFPVNVNEIERINRLIQKTEQLQILADEGSEIERLSDELIGNVNLYVKIDCGTARTGFDPEDKVAISEMLSSIQKSSNLNIKGFLAHAGHSYRCRSAAEVLEVHESTKKLMLDLKSYYIAEYPDLKISLGDTPTCSLAEDWSGVDEIRPGNFTFYDLMQYNIGSCGLNDIAVSMLCPVVSKHKRRNELVIYGGAVHFSKDSIQLNGVQHFGLVRKYEDKNMPQSANFVKALSQEHGIISCTDNFFDAVSVGDFVEVFPIHSCLSADAMGAYTDFIGRKYDHFGSQLR
jgi:D-serine deaminase-like pyridoxal phosphate-dependent protein